MIYFDMPYCSSDLVSESVKLNPFARTLNEPWIVLGDTEVLYDNDEPFWRTVFDQDVDLEEGRVRLLIYTDISQNINLIFRFNSWFKIHRNGPLKSTTNKERKLCWLDGLDLCRLIISWERTMTSWPFQSAHLAQAHSSFGTVERFGISVDSLLQFKTHSSILLNRV